MGATKRPVDLPLTCYWSEHFSTWVIRDGDNHQIGQVDNEEKGRLILTAVNNFDEMVKALKFSRSVHIAQGLFDLSERMAVEKIDTLLAKIKEG